MHPSQVVELQVVDWTENLGDYQIKNFPSEMTIFSIFPHVFFFHAYFLEVTPKDKSWIFNCFSHLANGPWKKKFELYFPY